MSMVTAVKYLAEFAAEALRPWDPSRELAARMLADLPLMVRLRRDDEATADEVTHLVLGRFLPKPPAVEGKDHLPAVQRQCDVLLPHGWCRLVMDHKAEHTPKRFPSPIDECWDCANAPLYPLDTRAQHHVAMHKAKPARADAATLVAEAVAVLDEPEPSCPNCQHPQRRHRKGWGCMVEDGAGTCPCMREPLSAEAKS